jgi:hypothetical protein
LERDFCDFAKVIRIATYFKELLEMLREKSLVLWIVTAQIIN